MAQESAWEDPRLRGEDGGPVGDPDAVLGRPPPARGGPAFDGGPLGGERKTPACAGRTRGAACCRRRWPEDPRLRGEDSAQSSNPIGGWGRPPPARGGLKMDWRCRSNLGKTPACAGRTTFPANSSKPNAEDPRLRGEDPPRLTAAQIASGRPPPARGGQALHEHPAALQRKTPACAGRTRTRPPARSAAPEDPRLRGEDRRGWSASG